MTKTASYISKNFPTFGVPNIRRYYIVTLLQNAWFQAGNWILYVLLYMTTGTFAVYEAIAFGIGILFEIPSGAFADLFGRRRTIIIGSFMQALGALLFTLGFLHNALFFIGNLLIIVSFAFRSGAQEALIYDSLKDEGKEEHYDEIVGKVRSLVSLTIVVASLVGGLAWVFSIYIPWILTTLAFVANFFVTLRYTEPKTTSEQVTIASFIAQNKKGFHYLFRSQLRYYTYSFAVLLGSFTMWHSGIIRSLMGADFGYDGQTINYLIAITSVMGFLVSFNFSRIRKKLGDTKGYLLLLLLSTFAWALSALFTDSLLIGLIVFSGITIAGVLGEVWTSVVLNSHIESHHRATALSTLSFLIQIPYVLIVVAFGALIEGGGVSLFYGLAAGFLFLGALLFYRAEKLSKKHD